MAGGAPGLGVLASSAAGLAGHQGWTKVQGDVWAMGWPLGLCWAGGSMTQTPNGEGTLPGCRGAPEPTPPESPSAMPVPGAERVLTVIAWGWPRPGPVGRGGPVYVVAVGARPIPGPSAIARGTASWKVAASRAHLCSGLLAHSHPAALGFMHRPSWTPEPGLWLPPRAGGVRGPCRRAGGACAFTPSSNAVLGVLINLMTYLHLQ